MINRKIALGTAISGLLAIVTVVAITGQLAKSQTSTASAPTTSNVNFTQLFKEKLKSPYPLLDAHVVYESPSTVVLDGEQLAIGPGGIVNNQYLWQVVKEQGYVIDSVTISGLGIENNPCVYHVILSHK